eukprot:1063792-Rhodomonas_salina.1
MARYSGVSTGCGVASYASSVLDFGEDIGEVSTGHGVARYPLVWRSVCDTRSWYWKARGDMRGFCWTW